MFTVNKNPSPRDLRNFGWSMLAGLGVIGALLWLTAWRSSDEASIVSWRGSGRQVAAVVSWGVGLSLFTIAHVSPSFARAVYVTWMRVTIPIGILMSTVLLSALFLGVLPLFALIVRLGDPLRRKIHAGGTYWEPYRPYEPTMERMKRPF